MPGGIGSNLPNPDSLPDSFHSKVYFGYKFPRNELCAKRILLTCQNRENIVVCLWRIAPAVNNGLHRRGDNGPYRFFLPACTLGLLTGEANFAVFNIFELQPNKVGDVDSITQVEEQPIIPVFGRCFGAIIKTGYLPYCLLYTSPSPRD